MPLVSNMELRGRKIGEEIGELRGIERGKEIIIIGSRESHQESVTISVKSIPIQLSLFSDKFLCSYYMTDNIL